MRTPSISTMPSRLRVAASRLRSIMTLSPKRKITVTDNELSLRRSTLVVGDGGFIPERRSHSVPSVFASQYAALEKEEESASEPEIDEDPVVSAIKVEIDEFRMTMVSQRSNELVLASLKKDVDSTRKQLHMTARVATGLVKWRRRAQASAAANA